jgi:putative DNA primase/helicase
MQGRFLDYYQEQGPLQADGGEWRGPCPLHGGEGPNFAVDPETGQWYCHTQCQSGGDVFRFAQKRDGLSFPQAVENIAAWAGLPTGAAIIAPPPPKASGAKQSAGGPSGAKPKKIGTITETYDYTDAAGILLFQVLRYQPKDFRQRRPDGSGGWIWNLTGTAPVLYHLPAVLAAAAAGKAIYICEGEKDANALAALGLVATTAPGGAKKWRQEYADSLSGCPGVVLLPDNDAAGRLHAIQVAASLFQSGPQRVRVLALPGLPSGGGDVSDWLSAGGTAEQLVSLAKDAPDWEPAPKEALPLGPGDVRLNAEPTETPPLTDMGNGQRLARRHGKDLRYCHPWGKWLIWDGDRWQKDDTGEIDRRAKDAARHIFQEAADCRDTARQSELAKHATRSQSHARLQSMIALSDSEPGIPARVSDWDQKPWLLACTNGTVDLKTGCLAASLRGDLGTKRAGTFYDPDAAAPQWEAFLETVLPDPETRRFFQRAAGYALTGDVSAQCLFFLYGSGSNGKSTALRGLMEAMGDYALQAAPDLLIAREGGGGPNNDVAELQGTRLVATIEVESGQKMAEGLVKQITGGDRIKARYMRQDFFEFDPTHKIFLAANHKPVIRGQDFAIWRRIKVIPFEVQIGDDQKDPQLPEKLRAEMPGILAWAVRGCLDWQKGGLAEPTAVTGATAAYQAGEDVLADFLSDCCLLRPSLKVTAATLHTAYMKWAEENSDRAMSKKHFGARLQEGRGVRPAIGIGPKKSRGWAGIGLLDTESSAVFDIPETEKSDKVTNPDHFFAFSPIDSLLIESREVIVNFTSPNVTLSLESETEKQCAEALLDYLSRSQPVRHPQLLTEMQAKGHADEVAKRMINKLQVAGLIENDAYGGGYSLVAAPPEMPDEEAKPDEEGGSAPKLD